ELRLRHASLPICCREHRGWRSLLHPRLPRHCASRCTPSGTGHRYFFCACPGSFALCSVQRTASPEHPTSVRHKFLNPPTMPATRGYTHVVETRGASRTVYLAGQLGMTPDGKFAGGPGDFRAQAAQAFENLKLGLAAVGASFDHVVKVTVYFTDMA